MSKFVFSLIVFLFTSGALAQELTPQEQIQRGQEFIQAWNQLESQNSRIYHKYLVILEHIGPIRYQQLDMETLSRTQSNRQMQLTEDSLRRVQEFIARYNPQNFSGANQQTAGRVQNIARQSLSFLQSVDGQQGYELVRRYESDGYSVRRSLRTGMYHLTPEIARFAAAIVAVRIATCFGSSPTEIMKNVTQWQTPEILADKTDPVCVDEIVQMLRSPIFYVGFAAFYAANRASSAYMMQKLADWDRDWSPRTDRVARHLVPNLALAVGFMGDHLVKTLVQNQYLLSCGGVVTREMLGGNSANPNIGTLIATDSADNEEYEVRDFFGGFKSPTCRRAFNSISSNQFLAEELGVGLTGLLATAATMAGTPLALRYIGSRMGVNQRISSGANVLSRAIRGSRIAAQLARYPLVVSVVGGPVGFAIGTARMVVFLGLFEVINPYVEELYFSEIVKSRVDAKTRNFSRVVGRYSPDNIPLLTEEKCSEHYTGEQESGQMPLCTRLPVLAELYSFQDFSQTWRKKQILKEFYQTHGRWKQKLTSFINNYLVSLSTMRALTQTREMFLNFQNKVDDGQPINSIKYNDYFSQSDQILQQSLQNRIHTLLQELPDLGMRQALLDDVRDQFERQKDDLDFISAYAEAPLSDIGRQIHDILDRLDYEVFLLNQLPFGFPFEGISGIGNTPSQTELSLLVEDILNLIQDPEAEDYKHVSLEDPSDPSMPPYIDPYRAQLLTEIGMPLEYTVHTKQLGIIRWYLQSEDVERNVIGLSLFQEWAPHMYGLQMRTYSQIDQDGNFHFNSRGLLPEQWDLYNQVESTLENYSPTLPWELRYILASYGELEQSQKNEQDGQFANTSHRMQTKTLADFVLSQLMCGRNRSYRNLFGDFGGVALQFDFPQLTDEDLCENMVHEIHLQGERKPSPLRSVFVSPDGLHVGLHQRYIRHNTSDANPLVFRTEQDAGAWWNQNVRPSALSRLDSLRIELEDTVEELFYSKLSDTEIPNDQSWTRYFAWLGRLFGGQSDSARQAQRSTTTESLTLSLLNEFFHYRQGLQLLLSRDEYSALEPDLIASSQCLVELMNSLPEKKYRVTRRNCQVPLESVKYALKTRNGRYNSESLLSDLNFIAETDLNPQQRHDRVIIEFSDKIDHLFLEIDRYNRMINESFNFSLNEDNPS